MIEFLSSLAIWRITSLLVKEYGPSNIFHKLRDWSSKYTEALDCTWCISLWISIPFAIYIADGWDIIIYTFALSAGALITETIVEKLS